MGLPSFLNNTSRQCYNDVPLTGHVDQQERILELESCLEKAQEVFEDIKYISESFGHRDKTYNYLAKKGLKAVQWG